jgi:hypothetical protein
VYIRRLQTQNLKRLRDFTLDFTHEDKPRMWTVLIGENGTAKTSILQAIGLAAAGSAQVNTLGQHVATHFRDRRPVEGALKITAEFDFTPRSLDQRAEVHPLAPDREPLGLESTVELSANGSSFRGTAVYTADGTLQPRIDASDPLNEARDVHRHLWFVAGYGIARALPSSTFEPKLDMRSIDRLMPLFNPEHRIASTSFSNHFARKDAEAERRQGTTSRLYAKMLKQVVDKGGADLLPDITKLELRGRSGAKSSQHLVDSDRFHQRMGTTTMPIAGVALSHGYQSTFAWIADLVGHVLLESEMKLDVGDIEGLVLLDEIDLYLHPTWQSTFISALRTIFPKVQFVVTTHSPVVLAGVAPHEIVRLIVDPESGNVVRGGWDPVTGELGATTISEPPQPDPRAMTGSELYRSFFGIDRLTLNPHGEVMRKYLVLANDPERSSADDKVLKALQTHLEKSNVGPLPPVARKK